MGGIHSEEQSCRTEKSAVTCTFALWALVVSNHRPPPCKGASLQALYLVKRGKALGKRVSGFEWLQSAGMPLDALCVLFA